MKRIIAAFLALIYTAALSVSVFAHGGRTDSAGGHKDNQNVSGLGPYHYHCGGHPPHLHNNGVCPYRSGSGSSSSSSFSGWDSDDDYVDWHDTFYYDGDDNYDGDFDGYDWEEDDEYQAIEVSRIEIMAPESITINVGETYDLDMTVFPQNASDKSAFWNIEDSSVVSISQSGTLKGLKNGTTSVKAISSNGHYDEIIVKVKGWQSSASSARVGERIARWSLFGILVTVLAICFYPRTGKGDNK